jgi:hypothetical protein
MTFLVLLSCTLVPILAPPPYRLRLEDTRGIKPSVFRTIDWWKDTDTFISNSIKRSSTVSGHILLAKPITNNINESNSVQTFGSLGSVCFVDAVYLFQGAVPCFKCFITEKKSTNGYAIRIQDTCIWLLVSDVYNLIKCNECCCKLNREFNEIQTGFLRLLLS